MVVWRKLVWRKLVWRRLVWLLCAAGCVSVAGCTATGITGPRSTEGALQDSEELAACVGFYQEVDRTVASAGVGDAQAARIAGFPYLRVSRLLAAVAPEPDSAIFPAWVDRLQQLDGEARRIELANLPPGAAAPDWESRLEACAGLLRRQHLADPDKRARLAQARVPDDYQPVMRVLGLYPLTSIPFMLGVRNLHRETRETFATPLDQLPVAGTLTRIAPAEPATLDPRAVAAVLSRASDNPLSIPEPSPAELNRLFRAFAPVWEIDVVSAADEPGRPVLDGPGPPRVTGEPAVYTHASHTRWRNATLLQLSYVIWFPERPREGPLDLVGGHIDGVTWRVTLAPDGRPLLYDVVHNCGCYHKMFPTPRSALTRRRRGWEEPLSVPQHVPDGAGPLVLRVSAGTHYLERVYRASGESLSAGAYQIRPYRELRSLPVSGGGRRSLFRPDGIVPGTARRERWLFWPMGVPEPGAMRQWGNHAIAFVGRRHFDDPYLIDAYFDPAPSGGG